MPIHFYLQILNNKIYQTITFVVVYLCTQWKTLWKRDMYASIIITQRNTVAIPNNSSIMIQVQLSLKCFYKFPLCHAEKHDCSPAFGDTTNCHTVHRRMMFQRCGLHCAFFQLLHTWLKLSSCLSFFRESVPLGFLQL